MLPKRPKVIGIGFHKTGTTSLCDALQILRYRVTGPNWVNDPQIRTKVYDLARNELKSYDAVQDNPWPILFKEVDRWYPGSKFILTVRPTASWIRSTVNYFGDATTPMREWIYGVGSPKGNERIYVERYERHNRDVAEYFRDRPDDLLILDITRGEGWEKLCPFLDIAVPSAAFPHSNANPSRASRFFARFKRALKVDKAHAR